MKVDVLLGLQWGDEGKGKVVDVLTPRYDIVARFQGGPNAGHTLEFEGKKYYIIREDYAGEYDIQEFGFPTFNVPDDVEQQKVMSFEEYKKYCEKFNLKQKYVF